MIRPKKNSGTGACRDGENIREERAIGGHEEGQETSRETEDTGSGRSVEVPGNGYNWRTRNTRRQSKEKGVKQLVSRPRKGQRPIKKLKGPSIREEGTKGQRRDKGEMAYGKRVAQGTQVQERQRQE